MTFREFVTLWKENWHLDPEHIWFMDPHMSRFLSPAELEMMFRKAQEKNWKNKGVDPADDSGLTQMFDPDDPGLTAIHKPKMVAHITSTSSGDSTIPHGNWGEMMKALTALKRRLDQLEKMREIT